MRIIEKGISVQDLQEAGKLLEVASNRLKGHGCCSIKQMCEWHERYFDLTHEFKKD
jgi:hypothetical protein